jgi:hypothetical protein
MIVDGEFKLHELASALMKAPAGQSNAASCLYWAFDKYGKIEPPSAGHHAYSDPTQETADALAELAKVAAKFFGYEVKA